MVRRKRLVVAAAVAAVAVTVSSWVAFAADPPPKIAITRPVDGAGVPWRPCFVGQVSDPNAKVWLVIHDKTGEYYVQPGPISTKPDGTWSTRPYIAEDKPGVFDGVPFEAKAFANPKVELAEGQTLPGWPEAEAVSPLIEITRRDDAETGCSAADVPPVPNEGAGASQPRRSGPQVTPVIREPEPPRYGLRGLWLDLRAWVLMAGIALLCVMAALPNHATYWAECWEAWCTAFARNFLSWAPRAWGWLTKYSRSIWSWGCKKALVNFGARGFYGNYKEAALHLMIWPMLFCLLPPGLFLEAKSTRAGLLQTFSAVSEMGAGGNQGGSLLRTPATSEKTAGNAAGTGSGGPAVPRWKQVSTAVLDALLGDEFLLMALGLAALQAAMGAIVLRGLDESEALKISLPALFRARPIVAWFFLLLDIAQTLMAALRGFESSPDSVNPVMPTVVAALIAVVMPWVLGFVLHFAMESFANCLGPLGSMAVCAGVFVLSAAAQAGWFLTVAVGVAVRAAALAAFGVLSVVSIAFLRLAEVVGEFMRWLSGQIHRWLPRRGAWAGSDLN